MKKVTSTDVARLAGVSQTTVSFVLNNRLDISISQQTRKKVLDAAKQLKYVPGSFGEAPKSNNSKTIGLIVPNFSNQYYPMLLQNMEKYISSSGYSLLICSTNRREPDERYYLRYLEENGVNGVIFGFTPKNYSHLNKFAKQLPMVIIGETDDRYKIHTVGLDSAISGKLAAKHLLELGHKKIAFLTTPTDNISLSRKKRLLGVEQEIKRHGGDCKLIVKSSEYEKEAIDKNFETELGYELTTELIKKQKVTAIIGVNDMVACGAIQAIGDMGLSVPSDISVCGFDNLYLSQFVTPGITTIDHLISKRCQSATSIITDMIENRQQTILKMIYEPQLVVRNSTGMVKNGRRGE